MNRRTFAGAAAAGAVGAAVPTPAAAVPNGTRPTKLINLSVTSASATTMRVTGRLTTLTGAALAGMSVGVYAVGEAYFSLLRTVFTNNAGDFTYLGPKGPAGTWVQVDADGNGAYSRPYPTFARP